MKKEIRKKLAGGLKIKFLLFFAFIFFICNSVYSSRILDFETEEFIEDIIDEIKSVNKISRNINFIIISDPTINAFVNQKNEIYITSGLIENCKDYVALVSVIAHEIGHIDKLHVNQRIENVNKLGNLNKFSNLSIIAGSLITNNPEIIQGAALSMGTFTDLNIHFSKEQEREADFYSLLTLQKLDLYSDSIISLLEKIEKKNIERGLNKETSKFSTHPYIDERIEIIKYLNPNKKVKLNQKINKKFKFIQAKFVGYNNKINLNKLDEPFRSYSNSILQSKNGNLKKSLILINELIKNNNNNIFLLETKADILYSHGYIEESIKFYKNVVNELPNNFYAKIRIFENTNIEELNLKERNELFNENFNLLQNFYNNKNILETYLRLAKINDNLEWINFLEYWLNKKNDINLIKKNLLEMKKTSNKDLSKLIDIIYNNIK